MSSGGGSEDDIEERPLLPSISIHASLFALLSALVFCLYTLRIGYSVWGALCAGGLASLFCPPRPERRVLSAWVLWLAYGAAARYCGFYAPAFDPWLSVLPVACMLASHVQSHALAESAALALAACLPASSAVAPELSLLELAVKSALFAAAFYREEESRALSRSAWILYCPVKSPVFAVAATLHLGLTLRERKAAAESPPAAPPPQPPPKRVKKQVV